MEFFKNGKNIAKVIKGIKGTDFQKKVWSEICKIESGKVLTYQDIARNIGRPKSSRAVANACGKNPYIEIIPCHRVIRSDGKLGGYSGKGGIDRKKKLLISEGVNFNNDTKLTRN